MCACLGGNRQDGDSLVGFVAPKNRTVDTHEQTDFVNDGVKDLVRRNAPSKQSRYASKRGLLGLDLRKMRISSGAISDIRRHFVTTLTTDSTCPSRSPGPVSLGMSPRVATQHFERRRLGRLNEHLMRSLLYAALFFDTSSDEECDPDLAVTQLESIVWELDKLALAEQEEFRRFAFQEAARYPIPKVGEQIRTLVDSLLPKD